jgi:hypothetical protein
MGIKKFHETDVLRIKKKFIYRKHNNEGLIVDRDEEQKKGTKNWTSFHLNDTGCFIFELISKGKTIGEITKKLSKHYHISQKKALKDINEFIFILTKANILEV